MNWLIDEGWARLGYQDKGGKAFVHCQVNAVNIRQFSEFNRYFSEFKAMIKALGYSEIYSTIPNGETLLVPKDKTLEKFQIRFGMVEIERTESLIMFKQGL